MKLRLVKTKIGTVILCPNGTILKATKSVLSKLLTEFNKPNSFKGNLGEWDSFNQDMSKYSGVTLAYVDDKGQLIICNNKAFESITELNRMISASEYADKHNKSRAIVKRLCLEGRIPGAQKHSTGWLIPENAPYPEDKRANNGGHSTTKKKI